MKQIILPVLMLLLYISSYSQENKIKFQLSLGPVISIPKTTLSSDTFLGEVLFEKKYAINVGAYILPSLNYAFNSRYSLDFGVGYFHNRISINKSQTEGISNITDKGVRNIGQIQTPINFNVHFGTHKNLILGLGGDASFLISAKDKGSYTVNYNDVIGENKIGLGISTESKAYKNDVSGYYKAISFGAFIQLKQRFKYTVNTSGFLLLKIKQHFNFNKKYDNPSFYDVENLEDTKELRAIVFGVGIEL